MRSHWKSSENPLYVKIIWKKGGVRHVILHNEELHFGKSKFTRIVTRKKVQTVVNLRDENLETCLTKLKLSDHKEKLPVPLRAVSCEPTFLGNPVCKVVSRPNRTAGKTYFYVNHLQDDLIVTSSNQEDNHVAVTDTFTNRILQWLNSSSSVSVDIVSNAEDTIQINRKPMFKRRPKTSPVNGAKKMSHRDCVEDQREDDDESSFERCGRPQLHIFVPHFENDQIQFAGVKKCKSLDAT